MDDPIERTKRQLAAEAERADREREDRLQDRRREQERIARAEVAGYRDVLAAAPKHIKAPPIRVLAAAGRGCEELPTAFEVLGVAPLAGTVWTSSYGECDAWVFGYIRDPDSGEKQGLSWVAVAADGTAAFAPADPHGNHYAIPRILRRPLLVRGIGWYVDIAAERAEGDADSPGWERLARIIAEGTPCDSAWPA